MKPTSLRLKGLNSFLEEEYVDFSRLTELGIFGIFGPTGSGKSSILDAITLALYGRIPRSGGDLSGLINSHSDSLSVYFQFELGVGVNRKAYLVERSLKKDKHGTVGTKLARLCDITNQDQINVISEGKTNVDKEVQAILGLTVEDFTRSVVLPQGSFSEFLKLSGKERRNMLERIFALQRYGRDLTERIRRYKARQREDCHRIEGALQGYGDLSERAYQDLCVLVKELKEKEEECRKELNSLEKAYEENKQIWDLQKELERYLARAAELKSLDRMFLEKERILSLGLKAEVVKPYIDQKNQTLGKLASLEHEMIELKKRSEIIEERFILAKEEKDLAEKLRDIELPKKVEKKKDLERGLGLKGQIDKLECERDQLRDSFRAIDKEAQGLQDRLNLTTQELAKRSKELTQIKDKIEKCKVLPNYRTEVSAAYEVEQKYLQTKSEDTKLKNKIGELEEGISRLGLETAKVLSDKELALKQITELLDKFAVLTNRAERAYELESKILQGLEKRLITLSKDLEDKVRSELAASLAEGLGDKAPCPVCGSTEHPKIATVPTTDLDQLRSELSQLKLSLEQQRLKLGDALNRKELITNRFVHLNEEFGYSSTLIRVTASEDTDIALDKDNFEFDKDTIELDRDSIEKKINLCRAKLVQLDKEDISFSTRLESDVKSLKNIQVDAENQIAKLEGLELDYQAYKTRLGLHNIADKLLEIKAFDEEFEKLAALEGVLQKEEKIFLEQKEKYQQQLYDLAIKKAEIERSGKEKASFLEEKKSELVNITDGREIKPYLEEVEKEIEGIQGRISVAGIHFEALRNEKVQVEQEKVALSTNRNLLVMNLDDQKANLSSLLNLNGFNYEEEVLKAFLTKEEVQKLKDELEDYRRDVNNVNSVINNLEVRLSGKRLAAESWECLISERESMRAIFEDLITKLGESEARKRQMEKDLAEQEQLLIKKKELERVLGLLEDLDKLVQGNRLVEFVAVSQLRYIAQVASERLWDITRGRYTLELDEEANFIMMDHFNGGATRPTHTLSGGETFLTSLSLALALSTQIQLKGKAPLEFFFLDEGFGTLDADLLEVVMGSLERLHSQKLSVGLISHVEELKQRLPRKLIVSPPVAGLRGTQLRIEDN